MTQRRPRADAQRNRSRILAAATTVIAESGPQAPLDEIATRAGVGAGTLYRHFRTRDDLLLEVFTERIVTLCATAEALANDDEPARALTRWLHTMVDHAASDNGLVEALALTSAKPEIECATMISDAASRLLNRAQQDNQVRDDVTADDLLRLVIGIGMSTPDVTQAHRILTLALEGLARTASQAPRPSTWPEI